MAAKTIGQFSRQRECYSFCAAEDQINEDADSEGDLETHIDAALRAAWHGLQDATDHGEVAEALGDRGEVVETPAVPDSCAASKVFAGVVISHLHRTRTAASWNPHKRTTKGKSKGQGANVPNPPAPLTRSESLTGFAHTLWWLARWRPVCACSCWWS